MPRNTREWSRRKLDEACTNIDWTGKHLHEVYEVYNPTHPEIGEPLMEIMGTLIELQNLIQQLKDSY